MGYFSNGSEGEAYQEQYCHQCANWSDDKGCQIWLMHLMHNYVECTKKGSILHQLIPMSEDWLANLQCTMFRAGGEGEGR